MEYIKPATIVIVSVALLVFAACSGGKTSKNPAKIDSTIIFNYRKAYDYDFKTQQKKLAEVYYKKVYDALKDEPDMNRELYTRAGYSLAALKSMRMDFEGSMVIALEMYKTMEANDSFNPAQRETILSLIAANQSELNQNAEAERTYLKCYDILKSLYGGPENNGLDFIIHGANVIDLYYQMGQYDKMTEWIARTESALKKYEEYGDSALIHEYKGHLAIWRAILLQNTGRQHEAASVYNAIPHSCFVNQFVVSSAITYLHDAGRNAEIAELYDLLDSTYYSNDGAKMNFDNICYRLTPRYMANLKAGRIDDALKIGSEICEAIDSAVVWQRKDEAAELAVIYQTHEKEMALEESKAETRIHRLLLIGITLICMLIGYLLWRSHRYNRILASKNRKLFAEIELNRHEQQQEIAQLQAAPLEELSTEQQLYRRICTLMDEQKPYTDVTLNRDALAQMLGTNAKYVEQAIRQCSKGETVSDYINRYRLEHVARLLKNTNHPIAVIGEISGIPSRATLGRLFRIAYGMTPSEYRSTTPKY